jgi:predicted nuclease of predicted toxin-antitoxin system
MRILLDECVPWPMHRLLTNHSCANVQAQGWSGLKNGELLRLAETDFELFITSDQNIRYQQNLAGRKIAVLELSTNDIERIEAAASLIPDAVDKIEPEQYGCIPRRIVSQRIWTKDTLFH